MSSSRPWRSYCCVKRARKRSWGDRTWQCETVNITSGSRLQERLEETAADVVLFQEHRWTAPRLPEQRVTNSQEKGGMLPFRRPFRAKGLRMLPVVALALHGRSKLGRFRGVLPQHRVKLQLVNAVLPGGLVMVSVCLTTAIGYSEQNIAFLNTLGQVLRAIDLPFTVGGDFFLVGEVLKQSGWLHAVRARIAAQSNDTPACLDSDRQRQGHRFLRGIGGAALRRQNCGSS